VNQHFYLMKFVYGKKNELDHRVMPSTKKSKNSTKPELARVGQRFQASAPIGAKHQFH
jgi:hypothetical protein